jgi:hypothetical protein
VHQLNFPQANVIRILPPNSAFSVDNSAVLRKPVPLDLKVHSHSLYTRKSKAMSATAVENAPSQDAAASKPLGMRKNGTPILHVCDFSLFRADGNLQGSNGTLRKRLSAQDLA